MAVKFKAKKVLRGLWEYDKQEIGVVVGNKGENFIIATEIENFKDKKSIELGKYKYDIDKIEEGKIFLDRELEEDYSGMTYDTYSLPIIIRSSTAKSDLIDENKQNLVKKASYDIKPLRQCSKEIQAEYLKEAKETAGWNGDMSTVQIIFFNSATKETEDKRLARRADLLELVVNVDMDYSEDGVDLWKEIGVKKGNYVALAEKLAETILTTDKDIDSLRYTIDAIARDITNEDIEKYVDAKIKEAELLRALEGIRAKMSEEQYKEFVEGLQKQYLEGNTNESSEL